MSKFVRILVVVMLAAFAVGSVANATSATTMAVEMALTDIGPMDMADCTGCVADGTGGKNGQACDIVCTAPFVAELSAAAGFNAALAVSTVAPNGACASAGRTGSPNPYPPRSLI